MKYNFKVQIPFDESDVTALADTVTGLQVSGGFSVAVNVATNTELPENLVETLRQNVSDVLSSKLGSVEAEFVSSEH